MLRLATVRDAGDLARIINDAFIVEEFFKIGDRTSAEEVIDLMDAGGEFLVLDAAEPQTWNPERTSSGTAASPAGCVYLRCRGDRAYFGMLSIVPDMQRQGLGRRLIDAAESRARELGCGFMDIHIVNLRHELPDYYRRLGYIESGTLPFSDSTRASRPCFFIVMSKRL